MFEVNSHSRFAKSWYRERHDIDLSPPYQRSGGIWSEEDQRFLIDSMINDYDIPKIYLADFTRIKSPLNRKKKKFAVIDGKQRLEAIFKFFSNKLSLSANFVFRADPTIDLTGLRYSDLTANYVDIAAKVEEFELPVMRVVTREEGRIEELFVRLNKGASLTGAEIRNAMAGPLPALFRELVKHELFSECVNYQAKRGQNLNAVAKLTLFEMKVGLGNTKKQDLDRLVTNNVQRSQRDVKQYEKIISDNMDKMASVFETRDELLTSQGNVPVFYWFIRDLKKTGLKKVRPFLVKFVRELSRNRKLPENERNATLFEYSLAARSTNDQIALERRIEILDEKFS